MGTREPWESCEQGRGKGQCGKAPLRTGRGWIGRMIPEVRVMGQVRKDAVAGP